jgi:P pilus assembly chaperone PapD
MKKLALLTLLLVFFVIPSIVLARIGVGVATGKIIIEEGLNPGETYLLPTFSVVNTGDENSNYSASIEYKQDIEELSPSKEWFTIEPNEFNLDANNVQNVKLKLNIPIKATPGNYFAFIEAHPIKDSETPGASINIAAASKLYFTIKPANIFQAVYYKIVSFFVNNAPWSYIVLTIIVLASLISFFRQKFSFNISIGKKEQEK